jgi:serine/threonine protein phosphatase PrpC
MPRAGLRIAAVSHQGRRQYQEDRQLAWSRRSSGIFAVADGMGGHAAGDVASAITIEALSTTYRNGDIEADPTFGLDEAARSANQRILARAKKHPESDGLGTTLVAAFVRENFASIAHAGDSRAWLVTTEDVVQLTRDHSAVQASLDAGTISPEEAAESPYRHAILRNLGDSEFPGLEHAEVELPSGSILLLTSDGAHGFLSPTEILEHLRGTKDLQEGLFHLVRLAFHNGSDDNMTLVACEVGRFARSERRCKSPPPIPGQERPAQIRKKTNFVTTGLAAILVCILSVLTVVLWRITAQRPSASDSSTPPVFASPIITPNPEIDSGHSLHIDQSEVLASGPGAYATAKPKTNVSSSPASDSAKPRPTPTPEFGEARESIGTTEETELTEEGNSEEELSRAPAPTSDEGEFAIPSEEPNDFSGTSGNNEVDDDLVPTPAPDPESPVTTPTPTHAPAQDERPAAPPAPTAPQREESSHGP